MLMISRREGEALIVRCGEHMLELQVHSIAGGQIKLALGGSSEMRVIRKELLEQPEMVSRFMAGAPHLKKPHPG